MARRRECPLGSGQQARRPHGPQEATHLVDPFANDLNALAQSKAVGFQILSELRASPRPLADVLSGKAGANVDGALDRTPVQMLIAV
jgi:hypothetical protein